MEKFLKSRYRIGEKIGENPFSVTYKGYLMGTEVPVVVKIYKRSALNSPLINKLRPKVTKIISLDHPNIARVIDGDYGWQGFYFVREFIDGENIEELLSRGNLPVDASIEMIKEVLSSLAMAHENNIIHGAISTRNIFLANGREIKVTDFILEPAVRINPTLLAAAATDDSRFMSPEQLMGEDVTFASDVYSAGVVFYKMLTGELPYNGKGGLDTALKHMVGTLVPPSYKNPKVPDYLDEIVVKMLEKDPLQRINSAREALESIAKQRLIFHLPSRDIVNLIYDEEIEPIMYDEQTHKNKSNVKPKSRRRAGKKAVLFLLVLIAIAAGLWYAFVLNFISVR